MIQEQATTTRNNTNNYMDNDIENSNTEVAILALLYGGRHYIKACGGAYGSYQPWCFLCWSATLHEMEPLDMQSGDLHVTLTSSPWLHRSLSGRHEVAGYHRK